jgi:hypothetical protein
MIGVLIGEWWRINKLLVVAYSYLFGCFLRGIDLYFVGAKLGANAVHGEDPLLRWVFRVTTRGAGTKERGKRFGIQAPL